MRCSWVERPPTDMFGLSPAWAKFQPRASACRRKNHMLWNACWQWTGQTSSCQVSIVFCIQQNDLLFLVDMMYPSIWWLPAPKRMLELQDVNQRSIHGAVLASPAAQLAASHWSLRIYVHAHCIGSRWGPTWRFANILDSNSWYGSSTSLEESNMRKRSEKPIGHILRDFPTTAEMVCPNEVD